jgi:hypothetical protein
MLYITSLRTGIDQKVLRRIFGPKREVKGGPEENYELYDLYS